MTEILSLELLIAKFKEIRAREWIEDARPGNDGGAGHTLEDLLGIKENNFSLPDFGEFEIKTAKFESGALLTLFHKEPKPKACVPKLLKAMGWRHAEAGGEYLPDEMSFRSTTYGHKYSSRGFKIDVSDGKVRFLFDADQVHKDKADITEIYPTYNDWLVDVEARTPHYRDIFPVYYDYEELEKQFLKKLDNTFFVTCKAKKIDGKKYYHYYEGWILKKLKTEKLREYLLSGHIVIDFDARSRHNHGTKIRIKKKYLHDLFEIGEKIIIESITD